MNKWDRDLVDRVIAQAQRTGREKPMLIVGPKTAEYLIKIGFKPEQFIIDLPITQSTLDEWRARHEALIAPPLVKAVTACRHGDYYPLYCPYCKEIARAGKEYEKSCFPDYLQGVPQD